MIALSPFEALIALVLVAVVGGGGYLLGFMTGTDRATDEAERRQADELERAIALRAARRVPVTAQTWRPPLAGRLVAIAAEPDTMPLRAIPTYVAAIGTAAARMIGLTPKASDSEHDTASSPASVELAIALSAHRTEVEIREMIRLAEARIGRLSLEPGAPFV